MYSISATSAADPWHFWYGCGIADPLINGSGCWIVSLLKAAAAWMIFEILVQMCMTADSVSCARWLIFVVICTIYKLSVHDVWCFKLCMIFEGCQLRKLRERLKTQICKPLKVSEIFKLCMISEGCRLGKLFTMFKDYQVCKSLKVSEIFQLWMMSEGCQLRKEGCLKDYQMCVVQAVQDVGHLAAVHDVWRLSDVNCASCAWCLNSVSCASRSICLKAVSSVHGFLKAVSCAICIMSGRCQVSSWGWKNRLSQVSQHSPAEQVPREVVR